MKKDSELKDIDFPACYKDCWAGHHFGVCECEAFCPHKFDKDGNPVAQQLTRPMHT